MGFGRSGRFSWPGATCSPWYWPGIRRPAGFDTARHVGEEPGGRRRSITLAVVGPVVIGGLFYASVTYATAIGYGVREASAHWPKSASGLAPLADTYAGCRTKRVGL